MVKLPPRLPALIVSTCFGLRREPFPENSNPPPMTTTNNDAFHQLQTHTAEMERCHEEELRKLKADHNKLEAYVRRPQEDEHCKFMDRFGRLNVQIQNLNLEVALHCMLLAI